jgi:hypothetical protein
MLWQCEQFHCIIDVTNNVSFTNIKVRSQYNNKLQSEQSIDITTNNKQV